MPATATHDPVVRLAERQCGVVALRQLRALGVGRDLVRSDVRSRRWRRVHPGVFAIHTGPLPDRARLWAAVLFAGDDAVLSHQAAAWLWGLRGDLPPHVVVSVPHGRPGRAPAPGLSVVQSRRLTLARHPVALPPRTTVEETVVDLVYGAADELAVIDLVLHACQMRLTSPARLREAANNRPRLRWRGLLLELVVEAADGVTTPLERRYVRDVERPHGLPRGERNLVDGPRGHRRYRDVRYRRWGLVVELDGRAAHPEDRREFDDLRDNEMTAGGARTLRYGWRSVTRSACLVAGQVDTVLRRGGWLGTASFCGPGCVLGRSTDAIGVRSDTDRIRS